MILFKLYPFAIVRRTLSYGKTGFVGNGVEVSVPGLYFCGAHGNRLSGFLPTLAGGEKIAGPVMGYVMGGGKR